MDPHLFDVVWEVYRDVGAQAPIEVICGYRSPSTNSMLRSRSRGVAQFSQHTVGKAIDLNIPGVSLSAIRDAGLRLQRGGVGFYPSSGSPFVHLDTASVRHWPRLSREQLARVFRDGKTVHLAADGRPLPGYDVAARMIEQRGGAVRSRTLLASRNEPDVEEMTDEGRVLFRSGGPTATASASAAATPRRSLFSWLGGDSEEKAAAPAEPAKPAKPVQVAQATPAPSVPLPPVRPGTPSSQSAPAVVAVRPFESTISVAQSAAPGAFAEAPRAVVPAASAQQVASAPSGSNLPGPELRWVAGPSGTAVAPQAVAAAARGIPSPNTPLPPPRPGRDTGGGFELASASSRPAGADVTASLSRGLPAMITTGGQPTEDATPALAYASAEAAAPRALPAALPAPARPAAASAAPRREASREPLPRLTAPRTSGPGLPRLITTARLDAVAVDMRHPDAKATPTLLRGSRDVLDVRFARGSLELALAADHFAGPAIQALPIARFEVAALSSPDTGKRRPH
jgi:hypothetical protein